jgi:hypothetical protein
MDILERQWNDWINSHVVWLKPPDNRQVLERAALNIPTRRGRTGRVEPVVEEEVLSEVDEIAIALPQLNDPVLIAEIPRGSTRWNQANFDLANFRSFFGVEPGVTQRILLQHVSEDGTLGNIESRPSVSVKSHNYRFELEAAAGLDYPNQDRPIGVFLQIATRSFKYRLLMPEDPSYSIMASFLDDNWRGRSDRVRRITTNVEALRRAWPDSPLLISRT